MEQWQYLNIKYGGEWDDCTYIGGAEQITHIPASPLSLVNLRYNISNILQSNAIVANYELYILRRSRWGRTMKSELKKDDQLSKLCRKESLPVVYVNVERDEEVVSLTQGTEYAPPFDPARTSSFGIDSLYRPSIDYAQDPARTSSFGLDSLYRQSIDYTQDRNQMMGSSDWFGGFDLGGFGESSAGGHANTEPTARYSQQCRAIVEADENAEQFEHEDEDDDPDDESYCIGSDSASSEDETAANLEECTIVEQTGWIRREFPSVDDELTNWLVPMIPLNTAASLFAREYDPTNVGELDKGALFDSKDDLAIVVGLWHMERGVEYMVDRSDSGRVSWKCKYADQCSFSLRARLHGHHWAVHKFVPEHRCIRDLGRAPPRKLNSRVTAAFFARKMRIEQEIISPKAIVAELQHEFGIRVNYHLALRARHRSIEMIYGGYKESFQMLPGYLHVLKQANPGTLIALQIDDDGRFEHCFVALSASIEAFRFSLRPVIVLDGTHLKGKNRGILFVATTKDANEQVFPLAYGIGPIENDISWTWFLENLKLAFGEPVNALFVSDAHISITNAVRDVFPHAFHGLCCYHLQGKLKQYGRYVIEMFHKAAYAYDPAVFEKWMSSIAAECPSAYDKLMEVRPARWARSMCPVRRSSFLTSNAAESFNCRLMWARRLPIVSCLDSIRDVMEQWFHDRHEAASMSNLVTSEEIYKKLAVSAEKARRFNVVRMSGAQYNVHEGRTKDAFVVDLEDRSCWCREFELDGLPCAHAIAAIQKRRESIYDYVDYYYKRDAAIQAYSGSILRVPLRGEWSIPNSLRNMSVSPPAAVRQAGRPRTNRIRSSGESSRRRRNTDENNEASSSRSRRPKRCGLCGVPGHTRRTCGQREVQQ